MYKLESVIIKYMWEICIVRNFNILSRNREICNVPNPILTEDYTSTISTLSFCMLHTLLPPSKSCGSEWGLWGRCQLPVVTDQLQTLRQLQVPNPEERGLQPHAVCKGNKEPSWDFLRNQNSALYVLYTF